MAKKEANPTVGQIVGENLRVLREATGLTHDQLSRRLVFQGGLPWTPDVISAIEGGSRRGLEVSELVMLAQALELNVADLFKGTGDVRLSRYAVVDRIGMRSLLSGRSKAGHFRLDFEPKPDLSEAELHAAAQLGLKFPWNIRELAEKRWGRRLDQERDRRIGKQLGKLDRNERRARRGRVTRTLLDELREIPGGEG